MVDVMPRSMGGVVWKLELCVHAATAATVSVNGR
jgi:hypothetical protein